MTFPCRGWLITDTAKGRSYQEVIVRGLTQGGQRYRFEAIVETRLPGRSGRRIQPGGESLVLAWSVTFRPPAVIREQTAMLPGLPA